MSHSRRSFNAPFGRAGSGRRLAGSSPRSGLRARLPYYAAAGCIAVATLAYMDGGEEPIRPIVQQIALPSETAGDQ